MLKALWPDPLAHQWRQQYPDIFDDDDVRLALTQPEYHFYEWLAAIHLLHRDGAFALVEHYIYPSHARKRACLADVLPAATRSVLEGIEKELAVQLPDLFVYLPKTKRFWFAEVKGPGDRLSPSQIQSHAAIFQQLGVPVEILKVVLQKGV